MTTMYRRRQWRDKRTHHPATLEEFHMSNQYIGVLCALSAIGTTLVLLTWAFGQGFVNAICSFFGG